MEERGPATHREVNPFTTQQSYMTFYIQLSVQIRISEYPDICLQPYIKFNSKLLLDHKRHGKLTAFIIATRMSSFFSNQDSDSDME